MQYRPPRVWCKPFAKAVLRVHNAWMFRSAKHTYLDHASATPVLKEALFAFEKVSSLYGNPGGIHLEALAAHRALDEARSSLAAQCAVKAREILFTSGLTEANNLAILGFARAQERVRRTLEGTHWIVSSIEHSSVLECFAEVERMGGEVSHVAPDERGIITPDAVAAALRGGTVFASLGWANNEIGVVQPLGAIARVLKEHGRKTGSVVIFHTDGGQAPLYIAPQPHTLGVDLFTAGSGKLYGPRGIGFLFVSTRTTLAPVLFGGGQERGLRAGTEDVALAAGFAAAFERVAKERSAEAGRLRLLRDECAREIQKNIPDVAVNGSLVHTLPHMLNISIPGINAEYLALLLDRAGFALSTKSACREGDTESHVVHALFGSGWRAQNTVRISLGRTTAKKDLERLVAALVESIPKARR